MKTQKVLIALLLAVSLVLPLTQTLNADPVNITDINAQWTANSVKISFNSNGGGTPPGDQVFVYGVERSLPGRGQMVKAGYTFLGWSTSSTATVPEYYAGDISYTAFGFSNANSRTSKTLYAVWKESEALTLTDFLGYDKKSNIPPAADYDNASLVEKVNYLESLVKTLTENPAGSSVTYTMNGETVNPSFNIKEEELKLPYNFRNSAAAVYNNEIHLLGGYADSGWLRYHYSYNGSTYFARSTIPYDFYSGSAIVYNNELHVLGSDNNYYKQHYAWNGKYWSNISVIPYKYCYGCSVVYNNELHLLGGAYSTNSHYKWDGSSWLSVSTLPFELEWGSAVIYNNEIHILGGSGSGSSRKHYKWDGVSWSSVSELPYSYHFGGAVVYNNEIHLLGGAYSDSDKVKHYKCDGSSWSEVSTLPYELYNGAVVVYNDEIHLLGGDAKYGYQYNHYIWNGETWRPDTVLRIEPVLSN